MGAELEEKVKKKKNTEPKNKKSPILTTKEKSSWKQGLRSESPRWGKSLTQARAFNKKTKKKLYGGGPTKRKSLD